MKKIEEFSAEALKTLVEMQEKTITVFKPNIPLPGEDELIESGIIRPILNSNNCLQFYQLTRTIRLVSPEENA